jgi:hypothetical protein
LLELEMLKGIWKVLFNNLLVSDYRNIKFTQAKATFKIADGKVTTEDLILKSIPADISARGWVSFDNTLNFDIVADVRETPLITSSAIQAVPTTIISQVAKNVIGIKLTGSLTNPKIKYKILPLKALKKNRRFHFSRNCRHVRRFAGSIILYPKFGITTQCATIRCAQKSGMQNLPLAAVFRKE